MKITFKNVGQGDSIIIEWENNGEKKIGVIDCKKISSTNPVLNYLQAINCKSIEFIILSHPHFDHFSGLNDLFNWALIKKVKIKSFLITCETTPEYIKMALKTATARTEIEKVIRLAQTLRDKAGTAIYNIDDNPDRSKAIESWNLTFLSPSSVERENYQKKINRFSRKEDFHNDPNGNWLSSLIKLEKNDKCILLTSDIEKDTLTRLKKKKSITKKIQLAQAPHHGSEKNHNKVFWQLSKRIPQAPIAISVGKNSYGHPSDTVINDFKGLQFSIHRTDTGNDDIDDTETQNITNALDAASALIATKAPSIEGDLEFEF